ncbi:nuclear transport factor 2 family protein [Afifella sp. H1R]|uniref:nuclear transport factor 2 family protein n=1 Tax=Afifella sp. H1R TaxID=2908841 RepID=UPI001F33A882|nr:nuclear transport factor 2 family protein [Afifella sp. H1R]MCF1503807.1 nuclear transport factor 2 family protein [Afifella sp. H1R]
MNLPSPIETYFAADRRHDLETLLQTLTPDAVVRDEGQEHCGLEAIAAWWRETKEKYRHCAQPLEGSEAHDTYRVRAEVRGDFPGSPAVLTFGFRLKGDRIAALEIGV